MVKFFQTDLISLFNMKKIKMGTFDDYELFEGVYHCYRNTQSTCYLSASASIYVPWTAENAAAIVSSIDKLSKYFAIYPLIGMNMMGCQQIMNQRKQLFGTALFNPFMVVPFCFFKVKFCTGFVDTLH
ncbi:MAG: hypothetical protein RLZZ333_1735 [Bacteroidota bacterium]